MEFGCFVCSLQSVSQWKYLMAIFSNLKQISWLSKLHSTQISAHPNVDALLHARSLAHQIKIPFYVTTVTRYALHPSGRLHAVYRNSHCNKEREFVRGDPLQVRHVSSQTSADDMEPCINKKSPVICRLEAAVQTGKSRKLLYIGLK
jgi:hypothetical protein